MRAKVVRQEMRILSSSILVLGSGMAGMLATKAVKDFTGELPTVITDRLPRTLSWNEVHGIHVLHDNCGLAVSDMLVTNLVILPTVEDGGQPELLVELSGWERKMANASYGFKVYGSRRASTSLMRMPGVIEGYDYLQAYNLLVKTCITDKNTVVEKPVTELRFHELVKEYDFIISTIPRHAITPPWVQHPLSVAYVSNRPPVGFIAEPYMGDHFVVYNTDTTTPWSRTSRVMHRGVEHWSTEYNSVPHYHIPDLHQVEKVMQGEEFALPTNVLAVGRFGQWSPGVLAHDAYWRTVEELRSRG